MLSRKFILCCFAFQCPVTFLSTPNQLAFCGLFSVDLLLYMDIANKVNECDNERLWSISDTITLTFYWSFNLAFVYILLPVYGN